MDVRNLSGTLHNINKSFSDIDNRFAAQAKDLDVLYLFLAGDIVLFLQAGFAFMECGVVRSKNTTNILIKNLLDLFISGIAFWLLGYAFTRGDGNSFIGYTNFVTIGLDDYSYANWFFDYVFASTASTIISGALAERCEFLAYLIYSFVITGLVYPVEAHWCWHVDGWLAKGDGLHHFIDYSGSGVVHMCGGVCGFVGSLMLGPRIGRFDKVTKKPMEIKGHSLPFVALGGFILIFGIVAFNGGSQTHISQLGDGRPIAVIIANTVLTGSFGGMTALCISKLGIFGEQGQWSLMSSLNGSLCAMIAICAGGERMHMWAAAVVGVAAGLTFFLVRMTTLKLKVDDPLDVVPVHFGGGFLGLISCGILASDKSWAFGQDDTPILWFAWNLCGAICIIAWSAGCSFILFGAMKMLKILRVSPEMELKGLDIEKHGEPAYPISGWEEEQYSIYTLQGGMAKSILGVHPVMSSTLSVANGSVSNGTSQPITAVLENYLLNETAPDHRINDPIFDEVSSL